MGEAYTEWPIYSHHRVLSIAPLSYMDPLKLEKLHSSSICWPISAAIYLSASLFQAQKMLNQLTASTSINLSYIVTQKWYRKSLRRYGSSRNNVPKYTIWSMIQNYYAQCANVSQMMINSLSTNNSSSYLSRMLLQSETFIVPLLFATVNIFLQLPRMLLSLLLSRTPTSIHASFSSSMTVLQLVQRRSMHLLSVLLSRDAIDT